MRCSVEGRPISRDSWLLGRRPSDFVFFSDAKVGSESSRQIIEKFMPVEVVEEIPPKKSSARATQRVAVEDW
eukprot:374235-Rhodomonas_salina.1